MRFARVGEQVGHLGGNGGVRGPGFQFKPFPRLTRRHVSERPEGVGFHVLTGHGASINTSTPEGNLVFGIFAALAEFEREPISERTKAGVALH